MSDNTIDEMKYAKAELEQKIRNLIQFFERKFGVQVNSVNVDSERSIMGEPKGCQSIDVYVTI